MGCCQSIMLTDSYEYKKEQASLVKVVSEIFNLQYTFNADFNIKAKKYILLNPQKYILRYPDKKLEYKQAVPHSVLEKWKLLLFGATYNTEIYAQCLGYDSDLEEQRFFPKTYNLKGENPFEIRLEDLYFHDTYQQIEKDSVRVYKVPQIKQDFFEKILKKIAVHFPQTGYTLGINYILGYFLLIGFSEIDCFWMFVHLAISPKFLALGIFQEKQPLIKILIGIFQSMLKRENRRLYDYIYGQLEILDESWLFKWFLSFYLSSFPIQFCQYIWDFILTQGILGVPIFAVGLILYLEPKILRCEDESNFYDLFHFSQNLEKFTSTVNIRRLMSLTYGLKVSTDDFRELKNFENTFYQQYFLEFIRKDIDSVKTNDQVRVEKLDVWYKQIIKAREEFAKLAKTAGSKSKIPKIEELPEEEQSGSASEQKDCSKIEKQVTQKQKSVCEQQQKRQIKQEIKSSTPKSKEKSKEEITNQSLASQEQIPFRKEPSQKKMDTVVIDPVKSKKALQNQSLKIESQKNEEKNMSEQKFNLGQTAKENSKEVKSEHKKLFAQTHKFQISKSMLSIEGFPSNRSESHMHDQNELKEIWNNFSLLKKVSAEEGESQARQSRLVEVQDRLKKVKSLEFIGKSSIFSKQQMRQHGKSQKSIDKSKQEQLSVKNRSPQRQQPVENSDEEDNKSAKTSRKKISVEINLQTGNKSKSDMISQQLEKFPTLEIKAENKILQQQNKLNLQPSYKQNFEHQKKLQVKSQQKSSANQMEKNNDS